MKKAFLIIIIDKKTNRYISTIMRVYENAKIANLQKERYQKETRNKNIKFQVIKIDLIYEKDYLY